ncbi:hypothetical protein ASD97_25885 [Streptomyces sp. Root63]|uniref:SsgA family sporulation/cell division regulator n=1 Tax=unclassified Streptomyces TaxID=2593676 RepID=UPI0007011737|nr:MULTISPECIES: SsgA family sporulation/cell division regulator [unclassified Streptomyces]KQX43507.1 hypothetical protein ASD29_32190 [Streptomyces sp. Root1295]KRA34070.1 hypothetical protein ASD97_25885 [Streptomyces sp. Root63]
MNIIKGVARDGINRQQITTSWMHDPGDPLSVHVHFHEHEHTWTFALDLLLETFTSPPNQVHGLGDVQIELMGDSVIILLSNGVESATLKFPAESIQDFLYQIDDQGTEEIIAREIEEWLEKL